MRALALTKFLRRKTIIYICGLLFSITIGFLPLLILRGDAYITVHDQLDSTVIFEMFAVRFAGSTIPEFLGGVEHSLAGSGLPLTSVFYYLFSPLTAFLGIYVFTMICSYTGMYLCLDELFDMPLTACAISAIYTLLPFYSYALSSMGQPLLLYACMCLLQRKYVFVSFGVILFFALFSGLVFSGYADVLLIFSATAVMYMKKHPSKHLFLGALCLLVATYAICNISLISQFFIQQVPMNRDAWVDGNMAMPSIQAAWTSLKNIPSSFMSLFLRGQYHAASLHTPIVYMTMIIFPFIWFFEENSRIRCLRIYMTILFGFAVFTAGFYAFWHFQPIVVLRHWLGGVFVHFQADRFYTLYPAVWYLLLGFVIFYVDFFITKIVQRIPWKNKRIISPVCLVLLLAIALFHVIDNNRMMKTNIRRIRRVASGAGNQYAAVDSSWNSFYSEELFAKIKDFIGKPQAEYKVGSIGLHPSVALFNGFFCIDGYSPAYPLAYQLKFRRIIAKELEKSDSLKEYFDKWGSRCYLFSSELGRKYTFGKNDDVAIKNLELNADALKSMGCNYIFAAVPIENPEKSGLRFLKNFTSDYSAYNIHLYEVTVE